MLNEYIMNGYDRESQYDRGNAMTFEKYQPATGLFMAIVKRIIYSLALYTVGIAAICATPPSLAQEAASQATQIVERADQIRFPAGGFQVDVTITNSTADGQTEVHQYQILSKGQDNSLVITTAPPAERGHILLLKGRDLWAYLPGISQPIRLPLAQRLTGQVANGDMARANFSGDYNAKLMRNDRILNKSYWVLELTAADRGVTYDRVLYWVDQTNNQPYKAEFYTRSNRLMKTCYYKKFINMQGELRPSQLVMIDNLNQGNKSTLDYGNMHLRNLPDKVFTKDYLKKLQF